MREGGEGDEEGDREGGTDREEDCIDGEVKLSSERKCGCGHRTRPRSRS